jgi:hypothetical protein
VYLQYSHWSFQLWNLPLQHVNISKCFLPNLQMMMPNPHFRVYLEEKVTHSQTPRIPYRFEVAQVEIHLNQPGLQWNLATQWGASRRAPQDNAAKLKALKRGKLYPRYTPHLYQVCTTRITNPRAKVLTRVCIGLLGWVVSLLWFFIYKTLWLHSFVNVYLVHVNMLPCILICVVFSSNLRFLTTF